MMGPGTVAWFARHELRLATQLEVGVDPLFKDGEALLLQAGGDLRRERLTVELAERPVAPERKRVAEQPRAADGVVTRASLVAEPLEAIEIERSGSDGQLVAGCLRPQRRIPVAERLADPCDVDLERGARRLGRRLAPELVDQPRRRDDAVRVEQQERKHRPLLGGAQLEPAAVAPDLERPEQQELERARSIPHLGAPRGGHPSILRRAWGSFGSGSGGRPTLRL